MIQITMRVWSLIWRQTFWNAKVKWDLWSITANKASGGDGIPAELFQILEDDAVKLLHSICQQSGKLSSDHRTGKCQFSFQSQRKAMRKNAQTTTQLHSSHMLVKYCSKFSKPDFNNMWTMNYQIFKLVLEKAEEPEIKFPTSTGSSKKQESSRKTSISALLTMPKPLTVWITRNWKILKEMGIRDHLTCLMIRHQQLEPDMEQQVPNRKRSKSRLYIVILRI